MTLIGYHASHEQFGPRELLDNVQLAEAAGFSAAKSSDHFHPWSERQGQSGFAWSWLGAAMQSTSLPFGIVSAPGYRKLTTQINIEGDPYLWDDFAFATREGLVPAVKKEEGAAGKPYGIDGNFALIDFDFSLVKERSDVPTSEVERVRA